MNRCPITYETIGEGERYSVAGLRKLSPRLTELKDFPLSAQDQIKEAALRAAKMSVQGVQPKLSAVLNVVDGRFDVVDSGGRYILKPQNLIYPELPENEDLTMKMAALAGIEVPFHGLLRCADGTLTYFVRRFDREGRSARLALEDFAQLSDASRDTKYNSSMEKVAKVVMAFCTFPAVEKLKLFRRTLFNFVVGNEDMHLKNFSLITRDGKIELAPGYDLLNSTTPNPRAKEEMALTLNGKKRKLTRNDLLKYYGAETLALPRIVIDESVSTLCELRSQFEALIARSFLSEAQRKAYVALMAERFARLDSKA